MHDIFPQHNPQPSPQPTEGIRVRRIPERKLQQNDLPQHEPDEHRSKSSGASSSAHHRSRGGVLLQFFLVILGLVLVSALLRNEQFTRVSTQPQQNVPAQGQSQIDPALIQEILTRVSRLIFIPQGVVPQIAVVQDPSELRSTPFFVNAQQGDIILFYEDRAIIYRPETNVIVNVGPIVYEEGQGAPQPQAQQNSSASTEQ